MGMFMGESGKAARIYGAGTYDEIESIYSRVENEEHHNYWFNEDEEDDYE